MEDIRRAIIEAESYKACRLRSDRNAEVFTQRMLKALRAVVVVVVEAVLGAMKHLELMEMIVVAVEWEECSRTAVAAGDDES